MMLKEDAIKAYNLRAEANRKEDEARELERKQQRASYNLATVRQHLSTWLATHLDANITVDDDGIVTVDGIKFGQGRYGLRILFPCPKCGEMIWSESFTGMEGLGMMLLDPQPAYGDHGNLHHCPENQQPDPDNERPVNETPRPTLAQQLESVVRQIAREEFRALQVIE